MSYEADDRGDESATDENSYFSKKDHFTVELINSGPRNQAGAQ